MFFWYRRKKTSKVWFIFRATLSVFRSRFFNCWLRQAQSPIKKSFTQAGSQVGYFHCFPEKFNIPIISFKIFFVTEGTKLIVTQFRLFCRNISFGKTAKLSILSNHQNGLKTLLNWAFFYYNFGPGAKITPIFSKFASTVYKLKGKKYFRRPIKYWLLAHENHYKRIIRRL